MNAIARTTARAAALTAIVLSGAMLSQAQAPKLRILAIGAHPDDCDEQFGGTAAKLAKAGHRVKFLSVTNGDAGHHEIGGAALAKRRYLETQESARRLGIAEYQVLDNHDGELMPTLEVRRQIIRAIREWKADIVLSPRPNDYHPDHRYTGVLVQDAAYMVIVPNVVAGTPALENNPIFLYYEDGFQKPAPFRPDVVVSIDSVWDQKIHALDAQVSQFYEWLPWTVHKLDTVPKDPKAREAWLLATWRQNNLTDAARKTLQEELGDAAANVKHAEAFELCEYGRRPSIAELRALFPLN